MEKQPSHDEEDEEENDDDDDDDDDEDEDDDEFLEPGDDLPSESTSLPLIDLVDSVAEASNVETSIVTSSNVETVTSVGVPLPGNTVVMTTEGIAASSFEETTSDVDTTSGVSDIEGVGDNRSIYRLMKRQFFNEFENQFQVLTSPGLATTADGGVASSSGVEKNEESPATPTNDLSAAQVPSTADGVNDMVEVPNITTPQKRIWRKTGTFSRPSDHVFDDFRGVDMDIGDDDDDDDDDDDEDDDDDDEEEDDLGYDIDLESDDECLDHRPLRKRIWDDEVVLKRQFSALIPAFDPRPGRNNVAHTTDIEITAPTANCWEVRYVTSGQCSNRPLLEEIRVRPMI
eukprot:sb/3466360/